MRRPNYISKPTLEMMQKICRAKMAVAAQKSRILKCPYCGRCILIIFEDTSGHIQTKCKHCGHEVMFDIPATAGLLS